MRWIMAVVAVGLLGACGSSSDDAPTRAEFSAWVEETSSYLSESEVDCVVDGVYDRLSEGDLRELLELDAESSQSEWLEVTAAEDVAEAEFGCVDL